MVKIEDNKRLVITIEGYDMAETYSDLLTELVDLMYCKDDDFTQSHKNVLLLLQAMVPDARQARGLVE